MKLPAGLTRARRLLPRPTLLGRAILLVAGCLLANVAVWVAAGIGLNQADGLLGIALLAWTLGLRHGLDADHISAIDNATRQMVSMGRLPLTCGLFFSLGHSTIVIAVNIAIAISVDVYDKLGKVGSVGGIVGASVSSSFLFLVACINTYFLVGAIRERKRVKARIAAGQPVDEVDPTRIIGGGCLVRVIGPILRAVDAPWKLYPVGILFGFGFDTASSIALLALSAIATRGPHGETISHGRIVILPFLFTCGMSLVDSLDSILMLYAYAQPDLRSGPNRRFLLFTRARYRDTLPVSAEDDAEGTAPLTARESTAVTIDSPQYGTTDDAPKTLALGTATKLDTKSDGEVDEHGRIIEMSAEDADRAERARRIAEAKTNTISSLSISLTLLSILVALSISLIQIMGLIGENCAKCVEAAEDPDGGGLAGSWWRAWARANDASGYVGAAIVGCFVAILLVYHGVRWGWKRHEKKAHESDDEVATAQSVDV